MKRALGRAIPNRLLRVLVVDDHPLFRAGLELVLARHAGLEVVGAATNAAEALRLVEETLPDLVLCDINLPDLDGIELTRRLRRRYPKIRVIVVTLHMDDERILAALHAGAAGFLTKDAAGEELVALIRRVGNGEYPINDLVLARAGVASRLLDEFRGLTERAAAHADREIFSPITPRELMVLDAAAHGQSNKEIARALAISDQTVKNHMTAILRKLAVNDRTQAVTQALRHGWLTLDSVTAPL
ncbi:response regulator transcription factor [soil metagenome]